jgi:beta-lactam-binding protein with PASTA domain
LGPDGKKLAEEAVTMTVTGGAPALPPASAAKPVVVPDVVGTMEYQAIGALDKAGMKINSTKHIFTPRDDTSGKVIGQSLQAGTNATEPLSLTVGQR